VAESSNYWRDCVQCFQTFSWTSLGQYFQQSSAHFDVVCCKGGLLLIHSCEFNHKGQSIKDVRSKSRKFDSLPPCPHWLLARPSLSVRTQHQFWKIRNLCTKREDVRITEEPPPLPLYAEWLHRTISLSAAVLYGQPLTNSPQKIKQGFAKITCEEEQRDEKRVSTGNSMRWKSTILAKYHRPQLRGMGVFHFERENRHAKHNTADGITAHKQWESEGIWMQEHECQWNVF